MGAADLLVAGIDMAVGVTEGGLVVITLANARKRRTNRQSSFGPTCRLVPSPEVGPWGHCQYPETGVPLTTA
jgi:hypothetical protein